MLPFEKRHKIKKAIIKIIRLILNLSFQAELNSLAQWLNHPNLSSLVTFILFHLRSQRLWDHMLLIWKLKAFYFVCRFLLRVCEHVRPLQWPARSAAAAAAQGKWHALRQLSVLPGGGPWGSRTRHAQRLRQRYVDTLHTQPFVHTFSQVHQRGGRSFHVSFTCREQQPAGSSSLQLIWPRLPHLERGGACCFYFLAQSLPGNTDTTTYTYTQSIRWY